MNSYSPFAIWTADVTIPMPRPILPAVLSEAPNKEAVYAADPPAVIPFPSPPRTIPVCLYPKSDARSAAPPRSWPPIIVPNLRFYRRALIEVLLAGLFFTKFNICC